MPFNRAIEEVVLLNEKLSRNRVWCKSCGASKKVDSVKCLMRGWPLCCGQTMTIDSPQERKFLEKKHDIEKVMEAIKTLDDVGRFSEVLDYVVLDGAAVEALKRILK